MVTITLTNGEVLHANNEADMHSQLGYRAKHGMCWSYKAEDIEYW